MSSTINKRSDAPKKNAGQKAETEIVGRALGPSDASGPSDMLLAGAVVALISFGVMMVYSASAVFAYDRYDNGQHFLLRQGLHAVLGLGLMLVLSRIDYHRLRGLSYPLLGIAVVLLGVTAAGFGKTVGGASRWIEVAGIHIQPAEFAKLAMILWLAYSLSKKAARIRSFSVGFLPHVMVAMLLMWLCLRQPDFGSAIMLGLLTFVLLFTAGARTGYMFGSAAVALLAVYHLVSGSEYRMRRITSFLSPFQDRYGAGYQVVESWMSFGAGGITGTGIGDGKQKLLFLPEAHTDFISAIVGEELGLIGFTLMVMAYLLVLYRGLRAAYKATDDYGTYLAVGVTSFIGLQAFINLGVAVGLLPTKGLVLPFISYGGNSLLVNCAAVGVLLNVSRPRAAQEAAPQNGGPRGNTRVAHAGGMS